MTPADPLASAPGRTIVPLDENWTAVILQPLAGLPIFVVGLFRPGTDAPELVLGAGETRRFLRALGWRPASPNDRGLRCHDTAARRAPRP